MGIAGGYLTGLRAAREDMMRERQQNEAERKAQADEQFRQAQADVAQANADRAFDANREDAARAQGNADREFGLRARAADQEAALKAQDMALRGELGAMDVQMKQMDMQGRAEDRALARERATIDRDMARERLAGEKEERGLRRELGLASLAGAKEDRALKVRQQDFAEKASLADREYRAARAKVEDDFKSKQLSAEDRRIRLAEIDAEHRRTMDVIDREWKAAEAKRAQSNIEADRQFRTDEATRQQSNADRAFAYQQGRDAVTDANEGRRLAMSESQSGLQLEKGRVESQILGVQLDAAKQRWSEQQKELGLREQNNRMGVGYLMSLAMMKPGHQLDAADIADVTKQYPEFAKLGLQNFIIKYNPDTGNMDGLMVSGDGAEQNSVKVFDQAQMAQALRGAGYTEESVKSTFDMMKPDTTLMKLRRMTTQEQSKQDAISAREEKIAGLRHGYRIEEARVKQERVALDNAISDTKVAYENARANGKEDDAARLADELAELRKRRDAMSAGTSGSAPRAVPEDPLASKYGQYLVK